MPTSGIATGALLLFLALTGTASAQSTHLLVVTGVSGDPALAKKFHGLATRFIDAAKKTNGVVDAHVTFLAEHVEADPQRIGGRSTGENITKAVADIAARARPSDDIFVLLIGHGSADPGRGATFNLPGPDLTADQYATLLAKWQTQRVAFVNTASASGAFLPAVAGPGRAIVTATRNGRENIETRFPLYFVEAYEGEAADADRNGRVSVFEAYTYAKAMVEKAYEQDGRLATEHALLDDGSDGTLAATLFLASGAAQAASTYDMSNPEVRTLVEERDRLEREVAGLRLRKDGMNAEAYERELETLLLALAQASQALQKFEAHK